MLSSDSRVGIRSICETMPSTHSGFDEARGRRISAGMWYFCIGISVRPALEAQ